MCPKARVGVGCRKGLLQGLRKEPRERENRGAWEATGSLHEGAVSQGGSGSQGPCQPCSRTPGPWGPSGVCQSCFCAAGPPSVVPSERSALLPKNRGPGPLCGLSEMEMTGQAAATPWGLVCRISFEQVPLRGGREYISMWVGPWSGVWAGTHAAHLAGGSSQPRGLLVLCSIRPGKRLRGPSEGH